MPLLHDTRTSESVQPGETPNEAIRVFFEHLFSDQPYLIQVWTGFRAAGSAKLTNPAERYYRADQLAEAQAWALEQDRMGREVYVCVHPLLGKKREKYNAAPVSNLWADVDLGDLDKSPIKASLLVESSPGRLQAYCRVELMAPDKAEEFTKRWAIAIDADGSGFDRTQLLRPAGTRNHKYAGWPAVKIVSIDDDAKPYTVAQLEALLPPLPRPSVVAAHVPTEALSDDDQELLNLLAQSSPIFRKLWAGDVSSYVDKRTGEVDPSAIDWALCRDLLRGSGLDADRTEHLMRQSVYAETRNGKWDDKRTGKNWLRYSIDNAIEKWAEDETVNASANRSLAIVDHSDGCGCPNCPYRRQVLLIGELIKADLTPVFKVILLRLAMLVGWHQSQGEASFTASAVKIAESIHGVSSQKVREVLHSIERRNRRGEIVNDSGLLDVDVRHVKVKDKHPSLKDADTILEYSEFEFTPVTRGAYLGFFEALVDFVPVLPATPPKRSRRAKEDAVPLPPRVVVIPGHPDHEGTVTVSEIVTCAEGGEDMVEERRYYRPTLVNASDYRSQESHPAWLLLGDTHKRSLPSGEQDPPLAASAEHACHACGSIGDARWGPAIEVNTGVWLHGYPAPCHLPMAVAS